MDGSCGIATDQCSIGAHLGFFASWAGQNFAWTQHATFDELAKRYPRFGAFGDSHGQSFAVIFMDFINPFLRHFTVTFFALDADELAAQHFGNCACGAGAEEGV